jgi:hypothetical protein
MPPVLYDPTAVPDVVNLSASVSATAKTATVWWDAPVVRSDALYDQTFWASDGLEADSLIPGSVNDGELSGLAFTWKNGAGTSRLVFHDPAAATPEFRSCWFTVDSSVATVATPTFEHSTDGVAWTPISATLVATYENGDLVTYVYEWASVGAKEYWAAKRSSGSDATAVTEVWFREFGATFVDVDSYEVYNTRDGAMSLIAVVTDIPTSTERLNVASGAIFERDHTADTAESEVMVRVVRQGDRLRSSGVTKAASAQAAIPGASVMIADGLNSDIVLNPDWTKPIAMTGVTAAYSIGGFDTDANSVTVYDFEGFAYTIVHDDASSTPGNRIFTLTGADITIGALGYAHFERVPDGFVFLWGRDSTGYK